MTVDAAQRGTPPALTVLGMGKDFGGTAALVDVDLEVRRGSVHALLGGNGSGKSTLFKCLAGVYEADRGTVRIGTDELPAAAMTARRAYRAGLRFVHQDLGLFETLTVAENIAFGTGFPTRGGRIRWSDLHHRVAALIELYGIDARPDTPVAALRPATKTLVAVARALQDQRDGEGVLLLDEPTASLPDAESRELMAALRRRAAAGQTIVLVSHRLQEVLGVADDITVFRDGRVAAVLPATGATEDTLVRLMTGRSMAKADRIREVVVGAVPALAVTGLRVGSLDGVDLTVARGEVVGLAGLLGSGRSTLLSAVFGTHRPHDGEVRVDGNDVRGLSPSAVMKRGVGYVPQSRLLDAAFPMMSVRENLSVSVLRRYFSGWMRTRAEARDAADLVRRFGVRTASADLPLAALSGGNQQKVVLARWLRREPGLLLLDEPTQGVDAGARAEIHAVIRAAALRGCGVLVASSDVQELAALCNRVVVLAGGRVAQQVEGPELSADRLTVLVQKEHLAA